MSGAKIGRRSLLGGGALLVSRPLTALADAPKPRVAIKTNHGVIVVELEAKRAPITTGNFLHYVDAQKYDGGSFYRASRTPGAPKDGTIVGGPSPKVHRFSPVAHESTQMTGLRHKTGTISVGRYAPGSATADFFICASPEPYLDAHPGAHGDNLGFAAFGQVVEGMNVVRTILALPTPRKIQVPGDEGPVAGAHRADLRYAQGAFGLTVMQRVVSIGAAERDALRDAVRRLLADHSTEPDVRRVMETAEGYDPTLWRRLAEMGVAGLVISESYGGSDGGPLELEAVMEEAGATLLCAPLLANSLAAELIRAVGDQAAMARLLPSMASGERIVACALTGDAGLWTAGDVAVEAVGRDGEVRLTGHASYVLHGQNADALLVLARTGAELGLFEVDPKASGVAITTLPTFDQTVRLARIVFDNTPAKGLTAATPVWSAVEQAMNLALVGLAGEQAGAAKRCLDFTVDYAKTRIQFGRPIGGFQAIKHMAADLLLESESATSAARNAAAALAKGGSDAATAVSLAAFACADAFVTVAANSIQMHGGVAFTWDHPAHLYLRRARADAQLFGGSAYHRERYLKALENGHG